MTAKYWGMETSPFVARWTPRFFVATPWYDEVSARLDYLLRQNARLGIIAGASGTGKSWCAAALHAEQRGNGDRAAVISLAGMESESVLPQLFRATGVATDIGPLSWETWADRLAETAYFGRRTLLICEDIDRTTPKTWTVLSRLIHLESELPLGLTILLTTRSMDGNPQFDEFREQATLTMELGVWDSEIVTAVLEQLLAVVGTLRSPFTQDAVETLVELSDGNPRRLMRLADLSLVTAAASELRWVDSETIRWVSSQPFTVPSLRSEETT